MALTQARYSSETYRQIIDRILAAADPLPSLTGKCVTGGRLNLDSALGPSLVADFVASPPSGAVPLAVQFTNLSSGDYDTSLWNFGDGVTNTLENPSHTYVAVGVYTVSLSVSGLGGSDQLTRTHYITVSEAPPQADFMASPLAGQPPLTVTFTDTSTGTISAWLWEFGDGQTSSSQNPTMTTATVTTEWIHAFCCVRMTCHQPRKALPKEWIRARKKDFMCRFAIYDLRLMIYESRISIPDTPSLSRIWACAFHIWVFSSSPAWS